MLQLRDMTKGIPAKVAMSWPAGAVAGATWQDILVVVVLAQFSNELLPYEQTLLLCTGTHQYAQCARRDNSAADLRDAPGKQDCCKSYAKCPACLHELNYVLPASFASR